ncbi:Na+/H+ antiporter subunit E [Aeromicrobium endophyticum]|uniref:Na+/H+ antiporter subunit E n=1 Tax=Aeromicrobium endophyticum TaxID=2292704 RepID=A0A371PCD1_9ACTN|nr:Na+/H+ antiporter subunit E [Aeromicrobium endophyticum]REK73567.1 Na+/H+ antiporter subunit E [Aeromicrobium endophyticum]
MMTRLGRGVLTRLPVVVALTIVWVLLWGNVGPITVLGGALAALLVMIVFPFPSVSWDGRFRPVAAARLVATFFADLVVASVQVAWIAVRPTAPPRSAVIRVQLATRSELLLTITAELISLVPGSLLIELDSRRGIIWLHLLDGSTAAKVERGRAKALAQEARVIAALGSDSEMTACRQSVGGRP